MYPTNMWSEATESKSVKSIMPSITFQDGGQTFFTINSKEISYNQDAYPNEIGEDSGGNDESKHEVN